MVEGEEGRRIVTLCFFNGPATTEIYTLSLHDALPISGSLAGALPRRARAQAAPALGAALSAWPAGSWRAQELAADGSAARSEEHTSELQSRQYLVCRLLLEKKKFILYTLLSHLPLSFP